jgi:hypothetical protein
LCGFGAFSPQRLVEAEHVDNEARKRFPQPPPGEEARAFKVRRALWASLVWVLCSIVVGYLVGKVLGTVSGAATNRLVGVLQIIGATTLLWGTLFIRGWDIQTIGGVTLTERVNRWLYRFLYCSGTAVIVASLALP